MAHKKTSKGKDESKPARTAANKARRQERNDHRTARMVERTQKLIGQHVHVRSADRQHPQVGTVTEVLRKGDEGYPTDSKRRHGAFVKVRVPDGEKKVSRHRIKLVKKEK